MKTVFRKIGKHLWVYLAWILVVTVFWSWVFGILTRVPDEEKITVFLGTRSGSFEKYAELNEARPDYVRELELSVHAVGEPYFSDFLGTFGNGEADILILPESRLDDASVAALYAEIAPFYCEELPNLGLLEKDGRVYGLRVHDKETHESLVSCLDYGEGDTEENYYLLFNRKSLHLGDLSPASGVTDRNGAIAIAKRLLSL